MPEKFTIKPSTIIGQGVFATEPIASGETILKFTGPRISLEQAMQKPEHHWSHPLQIGPNEYIDLEEPSVLANHSCSPNAGIRDDILLIALTNIKPGEEILYDYSTTMSEDDWTLECKCGSPNCRGIIRDFQYLPPEIQQKYLQQKVVQSFIGRTFQKS